MSESQGGAGRREVAFRLFAAEYDDADLSYSESDEERAPNYVVTPTGARVNRLFVVGVLTEVEAVSDDYLRARVVDPTGPFVVYAGQYQPEAMNFLERAEPPLFVAVTGKARTFQPEDSDRVYTSVRPESINEVDAETRDRWVVQAAEQTIDRVARFAEAKHTDLDGERLTAALEAHGVDEGLASGIPIALEHYGTTGEYLAAVRELATDAARVVAGERDEVAPFSTAPDEGTDDPLASLIERQIDVDALDFDEDADETPDLSDAPEPDSEPSPTDEEIDEAVESTDVGSTDDGSAATEVSDASPETTPDTSADMDPETPDRTEPVTTDEPEPDTSAETEPTVADDDGPAGSAAVESNGSDDDEPDVADGEEPDASTDEAMATDDDDLEEFDGEFDLDEDERAEIEEEYGTEFQSGSEVDEPGEADIETPTEPPEPVEGDSLDGPDDNAAMTDDESDDDGDSGVDVEADDEVVDAEPDDEDEEVSESAAEVALDDAVMDAMTDLDDGDGADRDALVAEVVEATGADPGDVEDAIQEALMDGRCYEPNDETLKAI